MSVPAPNPEDCQALQFKTLCRLRIFSGQQGLFTNSTNLVATAPSFGLIFVGTPNGFQVLLSNRIAELQAPKGEISEYPRREVQLGCAPSHLSVSCDQTLLAVAFVNNECPTALIYNIASFCSRNVSVAMSIRLASSPGNKVLDFQFNPGLPQYIAACTSDGGVGVYVLKGESFDVSTLPAAVHATCLCWSPKGKQLIIGDSNGNVSQFKPDLAIVKRYAPPQDKPQSAIVNLLWISNYQFAAVYADKANPSERPGIMIVNVPKNGPTSYINFEDICYSAGDFRSPQFYMVLQAKWNVMMVASANSMEVGVLAMAQDQVSWVQWTQEDAARAELPLTPSKQETYPVGLALDTSSIRQLPWGENNSLHPMPLLHILSHDGLLCIFHVINILPQAVCVCEPPKPLPDMSGLDQFVIGPPAQQSQPPQQQPPPPQSSQPPASALISQTPQQSQIFQPHQLTSSTPLSTSLFQPASSAQQQVTPPIKPIATNPLAQLASMNSQLQQAPQTPKATTFGMGGLQYNTAPSAAQPQAKFSLSSSAAPVVPSSSFSFTQAPASSSAAGSAQSPQPAAPPPSYSIPQTTLQQVSTAPAQRPSAVVPVPPVQTSTSGSAAPRAPDNKSASNSVETPEEKVETVDPAIYVEHIQTEIVEFEKEFDRLKHLVFQELPPIGTDEEKKNLLRASEDLGVFFKELTKSIEDLKHDVHEVKTIGMEALLWVEDAKSRQRHFNKPSYLQLVKAQELDPVSARALFNIQQKFNYVEIQLGNVDKQLSHEWGQFQDMRSPRNRMFVPTMDEIYQTLVKQKSTVKGLQITLDDLAKRIVAKKLGNSNRIPLINDSVLARKSAARRLQLKENDTSFKSDIDLSSLAENLLESQLKRQQSDESDLESLASRALNLNIKKLPLPPNTQKHLSRKKEDKLRELLQQIPMARIKADRDSSSVGNRPFVKFSSSVLSLSPSKPSSSAKTSATKVPTATSASTNTDPLADSSDIKSAAGFTTSKVFGADVKFTSHLKPTPSPASSAPMNINVQGGLSDIKSAAGFTAPKVFGSDVKFTSQQKPTPTPAASAPTNTNPITGLSDIKSAAGVTTPKVFGADVKFTSQQKPTPSPASSAPTNINVLGGLSDIKSAAGVTTPKVFGSDVKFTSQQKPTPTPAASAPTNTNPITGQSDIKSAAGITTPKAFGADVKFTSQQKPTPTPASSAPTNTNPLAGLSDMVSKAGVGVTPPKVFGTASQQKTTGTSSFSFSTAFKPTAASPSQPFAAASLTTPTSSSPIIVVGSAPSAKPGLLPTPNVSSIQSILGSSITITPVTAASSAASSTASSSGGVSAPADSTTSTTSFFGGMGLGSAPVSTSKPPSSIFGGSGTGFTAAKTTSLFGSPAAASPTSASGAATSTPKAKPNVAPLQASPAASTTPATTAPSSSTTFGLGSLSSSPAKPSAAPVLGSPATSSTPTTTSSSATFGFGSLASSLTASSASPPVPQATSSPVSSASASAATSPTPAAPTTTTASFFGGTSTPLFGASTAAAPAASAAPVFGQPSLFSSAAATSSASTAPPALSTATPPLFGSAGAVSSAAPGAASPPLASASVGSTSLFGGAATAATPVFGGAAPVSTAASSAPVAPLFGAAPTATASLFGGATTLSVAPSSTAAPSPFAAPAASTAASSAFSFSLPSISTTTAASTAPTASTPKPFSFALAQPAATAASGSVFGGSSGSLFGQTSPPATTQASFFGQPICSPSSTASSTPSTAGGIFGGSSPAVATTGFGTAAGAATPSLFGQSSGTSAFGARPSFGQSGGSLFGQSGTSAFGSSSGSVFGGGSSGGSLFGGSAAASPPSGNLFAQAASSTGNLFGQAATSPNSGSFSNAQGGTVEQSGFGSSSFQARPSGFGSFSSPSSGGFGAAPAFGSPPAFGGAATFGGAPAFGSPTRPFGAAAASPGFASTSPTQSNSTFEALATQDSGPTFGNLAQATPPAQSTNLFGAPASGTSFGNTGSSSFGGSSFSSWR